jgi:hypothetical protein
VSFFFVFIQKQLWGIIFKFFKKQFLFPEQFVLSLLKTMSFVVPTNDLKICKIIRKVIEQFSFWIILFCEEIESQ